MGGTVTGGTSTGSAVGSGCSGSGCSTSGCSTVSVVTSGTGTGGTAGGATRRYSTASDTVTLPATSVAVALIRYAPGASPAVDVHHEAGDESQRHVAARSVSFP